VCGVDSTGSVYGPVAGSCEHGDEHWGSSAMELVTDMRRNIRITPTNELEARVTEYIPHHNHTDSHS
jgi:hypothetical protein